MNLIEEAVKAAGGPQVLAGKLRLSRHAIEKWIAKKRIPPKRVLAVEAESGISRHDLSPELYPRDNAA